MDDMIYLLILIVSIFFGGVVLHISDVLNTINKKIAKIPIEQQGYVKNSINLSFNECNEIVNYIIDDIWKNKYFINYRLREITIIPSMDSEITQFVKEVTSAIGDDVMIEILKYYSKDYIIKKITRDAQMLFIEYTKTFKPSTK